MAKGKHPKKRSGFNPGLVDATKVMKELPIPALLQSLEWQIDILRERGVEIKDWENKNRVLKQVRIIGGKVYFLAAEESAGD